MSKQRSAFVLYRALAVAVAVALPCCSAAMLQIITLPISFNFGGLSPIQMDVGCIWGRQVAIDGASRHPVHVRQDCGAARHAWKVVQETSSETVELSLGNAASHSKLVLTISPNRGQGVLNSSGSYLVQLKISYDKCADELGQTRLNLGPCPSRDTPGSSQGFQLQTCKDVVEPGRRTLTLLSSSSSASWQVLPTSSSSTGVNTESGAQSLACTGSKCILYIGNAAGRVQPGKNYAIKYNLGAVGVQHGPAGRAGVHPGGNSLGVSHRADAAAMWKDLQLPAAVQKCPPRVTRSAAAVMGACGSRRWLELQAAAVDVEEGPAFNGLKYYWYVRSAQTHDVIREASGPFVKLDIGSAQGMLPEGRRYTVNLLVISRVGGQVSNVQTAVGDVLDAPSC